jgi:hypothetical protein
MIFISHRGNLDGSNPLEENHPEYIKKAIIRGYDVEIDIWYLDCELWLGHDKAQYKVSPSWISFYSPSLWIHCKNMDALSYFNTSPYDYNYFSHDIDHGVLTSFKYIWSTNLYDNGILVMPEKYNKNPIKGTIGICSDYIEKYSNYSLWKK